MPVRLDLMAALDHQSARLMRATVQGFGLRGQRLRDLGRALPRLEGLLAVPRQRLDGVGQRLGAGLGLTASRKRGGYEAVAARLRPEALRLGMARKAEALAGLAGKRDQALDRRLERLHAGLDKWASRLAPALTRLATDAARDVAGGATKLAGLSARLQAAPAARFGDLARRLDALDRTRLTLGYGETLKRGYAVLRGDGVVMTSRAEAEKAAEKGQLVEAEFHDGRVLLTKPAPVKGGAGGKSGTGGTQGSLF